MQNLARGQEIPPGALPGDAAARAALRPGLPVDAQPGRGGPAEAAGYVQRDRRQRSAMEGGRKSVQGTIY